MYKTIYTPSSLEEVINIALPFVDEELESKRLLLKKADFNSKIDLFVWENSSIIISFSDNNKEIDYLFDNKVISSHIRYSNLLSNLVNNKDIIIKFLKFKTFS